MLKCSGALFLTNTRLEVVMELVAMVTAAHRAIRVVLTVMRTAAVINLTAVHNFHLNP